MRSVSSTVIDYVLRDQVQESFNILKTGREIRLESDRYSLKGHYVQKGNIYIIKKVAERTWK